MWHRVGLLGFFLVCAAGPAAGQATAGSVCTVTRVIDGDTFTCAGGARVRVIGMDSPERGQGPPARAATAALRRLLPAGRRVVLERDVRWRDRYGRVLAHVWIGDSLLSEVMVREGWAVRFTVPPDVRYADRLGAAEAEARAARRGLWRSGDIACRPVAYRHGECGAAP